MLISDGRGKFSCELSGETVIIVEVRSRDPEVHAGHAEFILFCIV